jgi:phosphoribosylformylglycinamidine synthase subunit PurQ / glutaminase
MEKRISVLLLKFPGTNCASETERALKTVGFDTTVLPVTLLSPESLEDISLVVIPGGFSYGDYVMAGKLAQLELEYRLGDELKKFRDRGGLILGICNGFQILLHLGLLPTASLTDNVSRRFVCRWVRLRIINRNRIFFSSLPEIFELPIAHAEGRFVTADGLAAEYIDSGLAALVYLDNVNGSAEAVAALQDETGRVFGLMPHPERFLYAEDYYDVTSPSPGKYGWGYYFFKSIYDHLREKTDAS